MAFESGRIDGEFAQRRFEFQPATADVARALGEFDARVDGDGLAGLVEALSADEDSARENQSRGFFRRLDQAAID